MPSPGMFIKILLTKMRVYPLKTRKSDSVYTCSISPPQINTGSSAPAQNKTRADHFTRNGVFLKQKETGIRTG